MQYEGHLKTKKEVTEKTKLTVYRKIYAPIQTYGSESWVINSRQKSKIQTTKMKYLEEQMESQKRIKLGRNLRYLEYPIGSLVVTGAGVLLSSLVTTIWIVSMAPKLFDLSLGDE